MDRDRHFVTLAAGLVLVEQCAGVVDQNINPINVTREALGKGSGVIEISEVCPLEDGHASSVGNFAPNLFETLCVSPDGDHGAAQGGQLASGFSTKTGGGAGDHHDTTRSGGGRLPFPKSTPQDWSDPSEARSDGGLERRIDDSSDASWT
jgi:hypothetical protein